MGIGNWVTAVLGFLPLLIFGGLLYAMMRFAKRGPPSMPYPPPIRDKYDQLKKLGDLKDAGILDDDEFREEKAKILRQDEGPWLRDQT